MSIINIISNDFLDLDKYKGNVISTYGIVTYVLAFTIILIEARLVVTPFLSGNSLVLSLEGLSAIIIFLSILTGITVNLGEKLEKEAGSV